MTKKSDHEQRNVKETPAINPEHDSSNYPDYLLIADPTKAQAVSSARTTFAVHNVKGKYAQTDLYMRPNEEGQRTNTIAVTNTDGKSTAATTSWQVFFGVNHTDVKTASAGADQARHHDAARYLKQKAQEIVQMLSQPGNETLSIEIEGHASFTGHDKFDVVKDKDGHSSKLSHNQHLSEQRAQQVQAQLKATIKSLYPDPKRHEQLLSRIEIKTIGKGDNDRVEATEKESTCNRNVTIKLNSNKVLGGEQSHYVLHVDKESVEAWQQEHQQWQFDVAGKTQEGKMLHSDLTAHAQTAKSAYGSMLLETTDFATPPDVPIQPQTRFLIAKKDGPQEIHYKVERNGSVSVFENDKVVARLHYDTTDGHPPKDKDILISSFDSKTGYAANYAKRDLLGEAQDLAAFKLVEQKTAETKHALLKTMDADGNGIIDGKEVSSYNRKAINYKNILAAGDALTTKQIEFVTEHKRKQYGKEAAEQYQNAIREIGSVDAQGHLTVSKEQSDAVKIRYAMFEDMLAKNMFKTQSGGISISQLESGEPVSPPATNALMSDRGSKPAGRS